MLGLKSLHFYLLVALLLWAFSVPLNAASLSYKHVYDNKRGVYIVSYTDKKEQQRQFQVFIPSGLKRGIRSPALLVLHGGKGDADRIREQTNMTAYAERYKYIVVFPETGDGSPWESGRSEYPDIRDDLNYFSVINDVLVNDLNVDARRIYVTGISSGGGMTLRLACERTNDYAGYIVVSSNFPIEYFGKCAPKGQRLMVGMSGTADKLMVYNGGNSEIGYLRRQKGKGVLSTPQTWDFWARHNGCSLPPKLVNLPDRKDDDTSVTAVVYQNCSGAPVLGYRINNGGHNWPGGKSFSRLFKLLLGNTTQEIDASDIISKIVVTGQADLPQ